MNERVNSADSEDRFDLARFLTAQEHDYARALAEIRRGHKQSHWMWYVFPQFEGLGTSATSRRFSIKSVEEARAFLAHPVLGPRLREGAAAVLQVTGRSARDIFGSPDDRKLQSSATLFAAISPEGSAFHRIIEQYFDGRSDARTLQLMSEQEGRRRAEPSPPS